MDRNSWDEATTSGDMFRLDVHSATRANFEHALRIAFSRHDGATHYKVDKEAGLVLFWCEPHGSDGVCPWPNVMDVAAAVDFGWQWLRSFDNKTIESFAGKPPNIDGDVELGGFRVYNEDWGQVLHEFAAIVAIKPEYVLKGV